MITLLVSCSHCQSTEIVRNGATADGRQRYRCRTCGRRSTADPRPNGYPEEQRELILRAYQERSSLRGLTRTFGVSRNTVTSWLKKSSGAPALEQHLGASRLWHNSGAGTGRTLVLRGLKE
jgi:transposase-like protein